MGDTAVKFVKENRNVLKHQKWGRWGVYLFEGGILIIQKKFDFVKITDVCGFKIEKNTLHYQFNRGCVHILFKSGSCGCDGKIYEFDYCNN